MIRQTKTENGLVRGIEAADPRITAFRGVPFAAPPTGKNRWRAPQPCELGRNKGLCTLCTDFCAGYARHR